jgi:hypothetical protein
MKWNDGRYSRWEKAKNWIVHKLLQDELDDMLSDARAVGLGEGYAQGFTSATDRHKQSEIDLYEQGKRDGVKQEQAQLVTFPLEQVIRQGQDGTVWLGRDRLTDTDISSLKAEAKALSESRLWVILQSTVGELARQTMFEQSQTFNDMLSGKLMLYSLQKIAKIVSLIKDLPAKK